LKKTRKIMGGGASVEQLEDLELKNFDFIAEQKKV